MCQHETELFERQHRSAEQILVNRSPSAHLWQDVDAFVAPSEGQVEDGAASVGHGRGLQLQHQVSAVGLAERGLRVLLRTHHVERLQGKSMEVEPD